MSFIADRAEPVEDKKTPVPKKRGRKKKSEIALQKQFEEMLKSVDDTPPEETVSRRGRPRKKVNYYELANPENVDFSLEVQTQLMYCKLESDEPAYKKKRVEKNSSADKPTSPEEIDESRNESTTPENNTLESFLNGNHQETETSDDSTKKDVYINMEETSDNLEATASTPNNVKDKKYNYTGETVKMMNTLFSLFSDKPEEQSVTDNINNSVNNTSPILNSSQKKRSYKKNKKVETQEGDANETNNIKCAICDSAMDKNLWSHHKQRYHNNLAWRVGDEPLDLNDQSFVMHTLNNLYKKKKPLYCDKCGVSKKSVVGFLSHRSQCLKSGEQLESVRVACEICGRRMLPVSMSVHMKTLHQNTSEKAQEEIHTQDSNEINKPLSEKRSAAKKAMKLIENVTNIDSKQTLFTTNLDFGSQEFAKTLLQKELDETQFIECKFSCNCVTINMEDALKHFEECTEKPSQGVVCKTCLFVCTKIEDMMQHLELSHEKVAYSDDDSNEDGTFTERETKLPSFLNTVIKRTEKVLFPYAFQWTYAFCEENYSENVFEAMSFNESNWPLLPPDEAAKYLPLMNESCDFARLHVRSFVNTLTSDYTFHRIKLFESEIYDDSKLTLFCGGPISCMAWLPTPHTELNADQVLAVAVFSSPDARYETYENYSENTAIQFWNFGKIRNKERSLRKPKLVYNLAISHGPVWHMEWCPSGCYNASEEGKSRMGLLAVAGSNSVVYIYSVPFFNEEEAGLYYKPKPVIKLLLQHPGTPLLGEMQYYATKISWSKFSGHACISVGYTNGVVALFDLKATSVILKCRDVHGISCIFPVKHFQAHSHAITVLSLYHLDGGCRWLLTGSVDRGVSMWDLNNCGYPICHTKKNTITDGFWLTNWLCCVTGCDEASTISNVITLLKEARDYLYDPSVTLLCSYATINAVAGSDWLNGVLHGNSVGELLGIFPHQLFSIPEHNRVLKTKRLLVGFTRLIEKNKTPEERANDDKLRKKTLQNLSSKKKASKGFKLAALKADFDCDNLFVDQPVLYEDAEEKYALLFCDNPLKSYSDFTKETAKQLTALSKSYETMLPNQYPLSAINKIMFNPNRQASLYFATGYQAGFVRVSWLEFLKRDIQIK